MAERFYVNCALGPGPVQVAGAEAHHLAVVCRLRVGDLVRLFNGDGHEYPATVDQVSKRAVELTVQERASPQRELSRTLIVAAPLPKGDRGQFLVEKLTELGVTLGAHTRSHRHLSALGGDELAEEIEGSARLLEQHTGEKPVGFAYPYGAVSDDAAALVGSGYRWGCTTELRPVEASDDPARLPRLDMFYFRERGRLETWGTARFRYYLRLRSHARRIRQRWATTFPAP